ncbi:MAG: glycine--tRNA ligase subunit beta [Novosphingobium sp.]|nr:glycine--tRNA ligase subunit beta [Novosphingobium sp.]
MSDFLLELRCEEIPARMQAGARRDLEKLFRQQIKDAGVETEAITIWSTPRRLALVAKNLPLATEAVREETKGPATSAPDQALEGFMRKVGLTRDQLEVREIKGKETWFAVVEKPGRSVAEVLAEAIPAIIRAFPWPKSMRWGESSSSTESLRWVRPLSGIVAILGDDLVECEIEGVRSAYATMGHRFHHPGAITIGGANDYAEKLRACHVIVDHEERQDLIRARATEATQAAGLELVEDEGLVVENAGLTEWPVPLLGRFDEEYLEVPPEVIQLTARVNQKYFVCEQGGKLANAFVCTANIEAADGGEAIVAGNRKVLAARLSDARFFWEQDRKKTLQEHAKGLERITFHEKLGTVAQRVDRIATVASDRLPEAIGWPEAKARKMQPLLRQAAQIAKADLVTEMVGEFPELQGVMGAYYAEGYGNEISEAIRDHYKPAGLNDDLPSGEVGTLLAVADKADALFGFFARGLKPTGSKDPFALRRAGLGVIRLIVENNIRLPLRRLFGAIDRERLYDADGVDYENPTEEIVEFIIDRLKVQQREAGVRHDLIDAVFALGGEDDLVRLLARVHALQAFIGTEDGTNLLAGYKRAANILKKENFEGGQAEVSLSYTPETEEKALMDALAIAGPEAAAAVEAENFAAAMSALASLRAPIDAFFENVTVNDPDEDKRAARLALLDRFRTAVHNVADFSEIEG